MMHRRYKIDGDTHAEFTAKINGWRITSPDLEKVMVILDQEHRYPGWIARNRETLHETIRVEELGRHE